MSRTGHWEPCHHTCTLHMGDLDYQLGVGVRHCSLAGPPFSTGPKVEQQSINRNEIKGIKTSVALLPNNMMKSGVLLSVYSERP